MQFLTTRSSKRRTDNAVHANDLLAAIPMATLRLHDDGLQPELVTGILGVIPDRSALKGATMSVSRTGTVVRARTGTWYLDTLKRVTTTAPEEHVKYVVDIIASHLNELRNAIGTFRVDFSLLLTGSGSAIQAAQTEALNAEIARARTFGTVEVATDIVP